VSIQAQIINLLEDLRDEFKLTYLFIAHDLSVVRHLCHRVAVMYLGKVVELSDCDELYGNPLHPYTRALLEAVPVADPAVEERRQHRTLKGEVPSPMNPPAGCVFHPRCTLAVEGCSKALPNLREMKPGHWVACTEVWVPWLNGGGALMRIRVESPHLRRRGSTKSREEDNEKRKFEIRSSACGRARTAARRHCVGRCRKPKKGWHPDLRRS